MFINRKDGKTTMVPSEGTDCLALVENYTIDGHFVEFLGGGMRARIVQCNNTQTNTSNNKILIWGGGLFRCLPTDYAQMFGLKCIDRNKTTTFCDAVMLPCTGDTAAEHPVPVLNDPVCVCCSAISTIAKFKQNR